MTLAIYKCLLERVFIFLVHGLRVEPIEQNVAGVLLQSVQFQWIVRRGENFTLIKLDLYNGTGAVGFPKLFSLLGKRSIKLHNAPERLNARIEGTLDKDFEEVRYKLILEDVQYTDKSASFFLHALFQPLMESGAVVKLVEVNGTCFCFCFCLTCFLCVKVFRDVFLKSYISLVYLIYA